MNPFVEKKAQEISFALLRIAAYIRRFELRRRIENLSYHLLENVAYRNQELSLQTVDGLKYFITLAKNVYELEPVNYEILFRELDILAKELNEYSGSFPLSDLESLFSKVESMKPRTYTESIRQNFNNREREVADGPVKKAKPRTRSLERPNSRQNKILGKIKEAERGRLPLKEIIADFPDLSERTIRYDLKNLVSEGKLSRDGAGPSSYYQIIPESISNATTASISDVINL